MKKHFYIGKRGAFEFHTFPKGVIKLEFCLSHYPKDITMLAISLIFFEVYIFNKSK